MNLISRSASVMRVAVVMAGVMAATAVGAQSVPTLSINGKAATVRNVKPGGRAVVVSISPLRVAYHASLHSVWPALLVDDDRDGSVVLRTSTPIPADRMWVVVDEASGRCTLAGSKSMGPLPDALWRYTNGNGHGQIEVDLTAAHVVVVRPGVGSWYGMAEDGSRYDADGIRNGTIVFAPDSLVNLASRGRRGETIAPGDLIVIVDAAGQRTLSARAR